MDQQLTGPASGEAAAPDDSLLAARLMREEFGEPTAVLDETAPVPVVATSAPGGDTVAEAGGTIHEEFAEPARVHRAARSHRTGMLAGLGVVGALLAVLVILSPGSGQPRLPVQSVHDVSPIASSGPKTAAATVAPAAISSTTSSTTAPSTPTTQPHRIVTAPSTVTYVYQPGTTTPAQTPTTSAPAAAPTTAPPPPPTTTPTTAPPTTTTTAKHCILGLIC